MTEPLPPVSAWLKGGKEGWALYSALGSFALYLLGYLALRFHLTVLGVGTDLAVVDERYFFTGARFAVYLTATLPTVALLGLAVGFPAALLGRVPWVSGLLRRAGGWWSAPGRIALTGVLVSVALIQGAMRQCFLFSNLLLRHELPPHPTWLADLLRDEGGGRLALYFAGLVTAVALTAWLWLLARRMANQTPFSTFCTRLLAVLLLVEFLFLPVNYGCLVVDKTVPRVADLGGQIPLRPGQQAWLVWEGDQGSTFFTRGVSEGGDRRALVTVPRDKIERIEILGQDAVLNQLFPKQTQPPKAPAPGPD